MFRVFIAVAHALRALFRSRFEIAIENAALRSWGAPRIHAELRKLGFLVSERTVSRFMPKKPVDPDAVKQWTRLSLCPALVVFTIDTSGTPHRASLPE
jgi:hypothetical protein